MSKGIFHELKSIKERDPAARNCFELILYPGVHALVWHRVAHFFHKIRLKFIARFISQLTRLFTGIEIHPGAEIGKGLFIDHGMGVVIGETTQVGDYCTIYQGATLGGTGKDKGKRHPTLGNNVIIGSGAKVLGPLKIGDNARIAANAVVLSDVPDNATAVGVPARVVRLNGVKVAPALDHTHIPDPVAQDMCRLNVKLERLEKLEQELTEKLKILQQREESDETVQ